MSRPFKKDNFDQCEIKQNEGTRVLFPGFGVLKTESGRGGLKPVGGMRNCADSEIQISQNNLVGPTTWPPLKVHTSRPGGEHCFTTSWPAAELTAANIIVVSGINPHGQVGDVLEKFVKLHSMPSDPNV